MGRCFIGTSGYVYEHWRGRFYPQALPGREWLPFYAQRFETVELNNPFYRLPAKAVFAAWRRTVPPEFVFAVKASRYHLKRLKQPSDPLRRLLTRAAALQAAMGPVLFQLPPRFHVDVDRLRRFLRALGRQQYVPALRAVLEVRHASWLVPEVFDLLAGLRADARAIRAWLGEGRDVYVYFNNDGNAYAVRNAERLAHSVHRATARALRTDLLPGC